MAWPKYPSQTELLTAKALASEATAPLAALTEELTGLREQLDAARQAVEAAEPGMSIPPADCTNNCMDGPCDCSGKRRVTAWVIDVVRLRAALGVEG